MTKLQNAAAIAKVTLGLLFASAFQVPMVGESFALLCSKLTLRPRLYSSVLIAFANTPNTMKGSELKL